ncbi:MAG: helix-turn-helix domain-containing protein [Clostridia bacterium]|nr:helix-turn-helix domain-containing protein [Clostridia bacterium]MDE7337412.1 helix-turn-helix domain-containing protein [Clostridia bacterium]
MREIKFKENLKSFRTAAKMTQSQLGKLINVDQRTISAWEHGICEPGLEIIAKLCEIFDETFDSMISV